MIGTIRMGGLQVADVEEFIRHMNKCLPPTVNTRRIKCKSVHVQPFLGPHFLQCYGARLVLY